MEFQMIAKTFKGLEEILASELVSLGANNVEIQRRAVSFTGDRALMYRANLCLRTASRILMPIATFTAKDADEVYEQIKSIAWEQYMELATTFAIDSTVFSETFRHSGYVTYRVKDAIVDRFVERTGKRPNVKVSHPDLYINVHIANEMVTVSLDSSGESLHKRGWREATTEAPINEALAAGMLLMAGWNGQSDLVDPMCGSGTFLIEAAMIALNIAPGIYRSEFAFEHWLDFDAELWNDIYNDDSEEREFEHHIYGSDASFYCTKVTEKNIRSAGLQKYISVRHCRMQELTPECQNALVIMNPPYGERLAENKDVLQLYREIGNTLKQRFTGSTAWIISSNEDAMKCIGLKPTQRLHLLNGELECQFNQYELFAGEHSEWKKEKVSKPRREDDRKPLRKDSGRKPYQHREDARRPFRKENGDHKPFRRDDDRKPKRNYGTHTDRRI